MFNRQKSAGDSNSHTHKKRNGMMSDGMLTALSFISLGSIGVVSLFHAGILTLFPAIAVVAAIVTVSLVAREALARRNDAKSMSAALARSRGQGVSPDGMQHAPQQEVGNMQGVPSIPGNVSVAPSTGTVAPTPQYQLPGYAGQGTQVRR